jgi:hypothetical protein
MPADACDRFLVTRKMNDGVNASRFRCSSECPVPGVTSILLVRPNPLAHEIPFRIHKNIPHLPSKSNQAKRPVGRPKNDREQYMFKLKPWVSDLLWRLENIEGMSRSEIVERAIIRLAHRRGIDQS